MKKLITSLFAAVLILIAINTQAQSGYFKRASDSKTTDTLTNAATSNVQLAITGWQGTVSIQSFVTKLTGTTAATSYLYASNDGTNYLRIPYINTKGVVTRDSVVATNVAGVQSALFNLSGHALALPAYAYYQIRTVGTGTQTTQIQAYAIWRKP